MIDNLGMKRSAINISILQLFSYVSQGEKLFYGTKLIAEVGFENLVSLLSLVWSQ
jgi:hypothetical protein